MTAPVRGDEVRLDPPGPPPTGPRPLRRVRRPVRARDAHPRARGARGRVPDRVGVGRVPPGVRRACSRSYAGRPDAGHRVPPPLRAARRPRPPQARGPDPHRLAQDQQRARPGAAHPADGQAAGDRRDRRRPARRRHRDRVPRCSASSASSSWARSTSSARRSTSCAWSCSAPRSCPVTSGQRDAEGRDQRRAARLGRDASRRTHYCIGSVVGPHPYPWIVREFQRVVGDEAREQCRAILDGDDPDYVLACVGGGSNAIGTFAGFIDTDAAAHRRRGRRARARVGQARRVGEPGRARACCTAPARCSSRTRTARSSRRTRSAPASTTRASGPSTPRSRPRAGRRTARPPTRRRSTGFQLLSRTEGIVPALEPAHAIGWLAREVGQQHPDAARRCW